MSYGATATITEPIMKDLDAITAADFTVVDELTIEEVEAAVDDATKAVARVAAAQADTTATDAAGLVTDFNALLAKLRAAGLMAAE